ncbi:MAG: hypothetical protein FWE19_00480 [Oscillospiraceae bacterium]|nr:hypothetical protein [Oscillospiraceae bacterium]
MSQNSAFTLTLASDTFNALKTDFNQILRQVLGSMEQKQAEDGSVTIKLNIGLQRDQVPDPSMPYEGAMREIIRPRFDHKVTSNIQLKDEKSGTLSGDYELVWDKDLCEWVMRPISDGQTSLFDQEPPPRATTFLPPTKTCIVCSKPAPVLCDACGLPVCQDHAHHTDEGVNLCPTHNTPEGIERALERRAQGSVVDVDFSPAEDDTADGGGYDYQEPEEG